MRGRLAPDPDQDGGEVEGALVGHGELVRSHGQTWPLLEPVDASFNGVPLLVDLTIETGWPASGTAPLQSVTDLFSGLGNDRLDAASTQVSANGGDE